MTFYEKCRKNLLLFFTVFPFFLSLINNFILKRNNFTEALIQRDTYKFSVQLRSGLKLHSIQSQQTFSIHKKGIASLPEFKHMRTDGVNLGYFIYLISHKS